MSGKGRDSLIRRPASMASAALECISGVGHLKINKRVAAALSPRPFGFA
jgi:hypothetical protein